MPTMANILSRVLIQSQTCIAASPCEAQTPYANREEF